MSDGGIRQCSVKDCTGPIFAKGFCNKHFKRWQRLGDPLKGKDRRKNGAGSLRYGYLIHAIKGKRTYAHVAVAERVFGKSLPIGAVVHHVDGDKLNNDPGNLVICPSDSYHQLLHRRQDALEASGNPNYRKCCRCRKYDDVSNMNMTTWGSREHQQCERI